MAVQFTIANAVTLICKKAKDPNEERYQSFAKDLLWEAVNEIIRLPNFLDMYSEYDIHGYVASSDETIGSGYIDLSSLTDFMKLLKIHPDPDVAGSIEKVLIRLDPDMMAEFMDQNLLKDNEVGWYPKDKYIMFYPAASANGSKVTVRYVKVPDSSLVTSTDLLTLFTMPFIYDAINVAAEQLINIRQII